MKVHWNWIWNLEQGLKGLTEIESNNHVQVPRYDDESNYLQALTKSIVDDNTLIITNVNEGVLDPVLGQSKSPPSLVNSWF